MAWFFWAVHDFFIVMQRFKRGMSKYFWESWERCAYVRNTGVGGGWDICVSIACFPKNKAPLKRILPNEIVQLERESLVYQMDCIKLSQAPYSIFHFFSQTSKPEVLQMPSAIEVNGGFWISLRNLNFSNIFGFSKISNVTKRAPRK